MTAVASRTLESAKEWAAEHKVAKVSLCHRRAASRTLELFFPSLFFTQQAYGSYDELLRDKDIDAVYVSLPTGLRGEWVWTRNQGRRSQRTVEHCSSNCHQVPKVLKAKKHILCEKPTAKKLVWCKLLLRRLPCLTLSLSSPLRFQQR